MELKTDYFFDESAFRRQLQNAAADIGFYKEALKNLYAEQRKRFLEGTPASELIRHRSWALDQILSEIWRTFVPANSPLALLAVGGYGRGELHPGSDIDIMVLVGDDANNEIDESISQFSTFLWDIGLEPGLSVRSRDQCVEAAISDVTIITNLIEARLICGPSELFHKLIGAISPEHLWNSQAFFQAKLEEQHQRHRKFHDTAYNLEPNIKEGPGGLRDIHMVGWVAKRHFRARLLRDLVSHAFLTKGEYLSFVESQNFLWNLRFALHLIAERREDRLTFDHQREIALLFGYYDDGKRLAVEQLMKRYYRTVMELNRLNEMLLQLFQEAILLTDDSPPQPINRRFQARNGFIEIREENTFRKYPFALLEIFLILEQYPQLQGVRASTIRAIRNHHYLIDERFRNDLRCRSLFMEIIRQPHGITHELRRMNRYGVLAAYLPAFGKIVGQMQYDLFHVYTVDEHSLFVLRNLRRFTVPEFAHEYPLCSKIITTIPKPELLYLGALFHDIAKGRGGDHSELGAEEARNFCQHHGLSQYDANFVSWLVRYHLLLSMTAQRKDISDPHVIAEFASIVETQTRLDYLYLLTVADIRGTNPSLWNNWREALLTELYHNTKNYFQHGDSAAIKDNENVVATQKEAMSLLENKDLGEHQIHAIWGQFPDEYFVRFSPENVAWHTQGIANCSEPDLPLVMIKAETQRGDTEIFLYTKDQERLFAATTSLMDQMDLNVVSARIITTKNGYTLDSYVVLEQSGDPVKGMPRIQEIRQTLSEKLKIPENVNLRVHKHIHSQLKYFTVNTQIAFHQDRLNKRTILELTCNDEPGLLSRVGIAFVDCNVQLEDAKVTTYGARAEDIFFITDNGVRPVSPSQQNCLRDALNKYLTQKQHMV